jgi:uncharacterized protein (DUF2235 family)
MSKFIIFCADGTWNGVDHDDDGDGKADFTNVYKLFLGLAGSLSEDSIHLADEQEKKLPDNTQIAKYIHGVGDSRNPISKLMGGAFGSGSIKRIVRGYTYISREYDKDDDIVIVGFSRGAYTARALAGLIASQGLLAKPLTTNKSEAYEWGARAWYRYRRNTADEGLLQKMTEALAYLPAFISANKLQESDFVSVDKIKAVAVWDTVGSLGMPIYSNHNMVDAFKFTNTQLSSKVEKGFHAIALDEQRKIFSPTLWDEANNVVQMVFPGAHADVGGGYTTNNQESCLSDIALNWMVENLSGLGVKFNSPVYQPFSPNPCGTSHKPWIHPPFNSGHIASRQELKGSGSKGIGEHPSVQNRIKCGNVKQEPSEAPTPYSPTNRP